MQKTYRNLLNNKVFGFLKPRSFYEFTDYFNLKPPNLGYFCTYKFVILRL